MASTSLGTLTLDLAVRLSEFTDGLSRAERETRDRTENMGASVAKFKEQLIDNLSGTPIGSAIDTLTDKLGDITEAFGDSGIAGAAKIGAASIIASTVGIGVALTGMAIQVAETDQQLEMLAKRANVTTTQFQVLTAATEKYGIDNEGLSDILADVQEKLGEFAASGAGGLVDTLELLQNNTKMTAEEVEAFGVSLSNVDGATAIQMVKDKLEEANSTAQTTRFTMESLASGLGDISEVWQDNGDTIAEYEKALYSAGVIRTEEAIEQSRLLKLQVEDTQRKFQGMSNQLVTHTTPALNSVIGYFAEGTKQGDGFASSVSGIGVVISGVAKTIIGFSSVVNLAVIGFQGLMDQFFVLGQTGTAFLNADGLFAKVRALQEGSRAFAASGESTNQRFHDEAMRAAEAIRNTGAASIPTSANYGATSELERLRREQELLKESNIISTKTADENAKAMEKQAKAADKLAKSSKGAADSSKYIQYANKGSTRNQNLNNDLVKALSFLQEEGIVFKVNSGGQPGKGSGGKRVGSTAHDYGYAADGDLYKDGRKLDWNNSKDLPLLKAVVEEAAARGINGIGAGNSYMGAGRFHFGIQKDSAAWGKDGKSANALGWVKEAHSAGMQRKNAGTFYGKGLAQDNKEAELAIREQEKRDTEEKRALEELERAKLSIVNQYATDKEKIESEHTANVIEIERLYAEGSSERTKYLALEEERYAIEKNAGLLSIAEKYFSEEERIRENHRKALLVIENTYIEDDGIRQKYIDRQNEMYEEDLANFRYIQEQKASAQGLAASRLSDVIDMSSGQAVSAVEDLRAKQNMRPDMYQKWKLEKDYKTSQETVDQMYGARKGEINATDYKTGDPVFNETQRNELLEEARQEHLNKMLLMEEEYSVKKKELDKQLGDARIAMQETAFSAMTDAASMFFGENSKMHHAAFAMERVFAVQKALMNVEETYSNTFNAISAIPLIGPYIAMPMAATAAAMQVARAASIQGMSAPSIAGIAHGGLTNVPEEATYLLQRDERVLSPNQNKDLVKFMANGQKASYGGITINESPGAQASVRREPDGGVTIDMVDKMIEKSFKRIGRANSVESKSIQRGTTARVNRR